MHDPKLIEAMTWAMATPENQGLDAWPGLYEDRALAALRALRDAGAPVPEGWVAVPKVATDALCACNVRAVRTIRSHGAGIGPAEIKGLPG